LEILAVVVVIVIVIVIVVVIVVSLLPTRVLALYSYTSRHASRRTAKVKTAVRG
jgi:hypothetical protein